MEPAGDEHADCCSPCHKYYPREPKDISPDLSWFSEFLASQKAGVEELKNRSVHCFASSVVLFRVYKSCPVLPLRPRQERCWEMKGFKDFILAETILSHSVSGYNSPPPPVFFSYCKIATPVRKIVSVLKADEARLNENTVCFQIHQWRLSQQ